MRMQNAKVIGKFLLREKATSPVRKIEEDYHVYKGASISTDGRKLWSYATVIAEWRGDVVAINGKKYSNTTTMQQHDLRNMCKMLKVKTTEM